MRKSIIANSSSLIALERINLLAILCKLYSKLIIPQSVEREFGTLSLPCLEVRQVESNLIKLLTVDLNLGQAEAEAIALSSDTGIGVIIDDLKARKVAENMGVKLTGTIGVLLRAQEMGLIESAYSKTKELKEKGFYVSKDLLDQLSRFKTTV